MSKVFIPQLPTRYDRATNARIPAIDVNPAAQFGELTVMLPLDGARALNLSGARERAEAIGPSDYILAVGDVTLLAMTVAYALLHNGRATLLRWDGDAKSYKAEEIKL